MSGAGFSAGKRCSARLRWPQCTYDTLTTAELAPVRLNERAGPARLHRQLWHTAQENDNTLRDADGLSDEETAAEAALLLAKPHAARSPARLLALPHDALTTSSVAREPGSAPAEQQPTAQRAWVVCAEVC